MPPDRTPARADGRRTRGQETRRRLLDATFRVIAHGGAAAVTHRAVAAEAGVTKSLATYHFATVDDLLTAALVEGVELYARQLAEDLPPDVSLVELAHYLADAFDGHRVEWLGAYELFLHAARLPVLREATQVWIAWSADLARCYTDDPVAIDAFVSAVDGFALHALLSDQPLEAERLARILTHLLPETS